MIKLKEIFIRILTDLKNSVWVIIGLLLYWLIVSLTFGEFCILKILTGFPCPGCGMTRAVFLMLTGHFSESFAMHPLALPWILLGIYFCICRYILNRKPKGAAAIAMILCILLLPVYIYRMQTMFPNQMPMTYTRTPIGDMLIAYAGQLWRQRLPLFCRIYRRYNNKPS